MKIHPSNRQIVKQESNGGVLYTTPFAIAIAHGELKLMCCCSAMGIHYMKLQSNSSYSGVVSHRQSYKAVVVSVETVSFYKRVQ